ncbi:integral membrane transport protein [Streptomyces sp. AV19]|uniref:integral membrane transport protein n=1 Tax=Streptomyces sp. AV19 TaxID=2793068 RepID=UPI0018FEA175|nr:integral membrane transport protein [Streptomyces sp. AV19]MBH1935520.1 integral membrane transport protein [Streptomyces sp. AV19]MDG4534408.1 integral membrane transport protein [Streptomyces sp. AV19]
MTVVGETPHRVPVAGRGGAVGQSVRDSLVVAQRNLIRMVRIPNPVRSSRLGFTSHARWATAGKEQAS